MFNLQFTEVLIILVVALVLLGPKQLPKIARSVGQGLRELRRAGDELKGTWEREVESNLDPMRDVARTVDAEWKSARETARRGVRDFAADVTGEGEPAAEPGPKPAAADAAPARDPEAGDAS